MWTRYIRTHVRIFDPDACNSACNNSGILVYTSITVHVIIVCIYQLYSLIIKKIMINIDTFLKLTSPHVLAYVWSKLTMLRTNKVEENITFFKANLIARNSIFKGG
jgi:hypothetical protein